MPTRPLVAVPAVLALLLLPAGASAKAGGLDRDHDRLPDRWETRFHVRSAADDGDDDGLTNRSEFLAGTNPRREDSDRDGTPDADEDRDRDGVDNGTEQDAGTDPRRKDTDGDGTPDGREDADRDGLANLLEDRTGNDPRDPDSDDDGIRDGRENAGRIVSFEDDVLTIAIGGGRTVSAVVDDATDLGCDAEADLEDAAGDEGVEVEDDGADAPDEEADAEAAADDGDDAAEEDDVVFDETCGTDQLEPGAYVHEAELGADEDGEPVWESVSVVVEDED
ncbi:MAG: hypothetical protein HZB46_12580 [Solirubrobacterales bacterium]|nr:hypothetical protein [Solirubrobacterales bacterium]